MRFVGLALVVFVVGCRTPVSVRARAAETEKDVYVDKDCSVHDYPSITDVPDGATNLGLVRVLKVKGSSDDAMFLLLREEVCKAGGNALSGLRWVKELGKISGAPTELEATAWTLP